MKIPIYIILFLCLSFIITPPLKAQVNTQDSLALVDFFDSTGGTNWSNNVNWLTNAPVSSWLGIKVSGGRVTSISLNFNNLIVNGSIPSSLSKLSKLTNLDLSTNKLSGTIFPSIGNLINLTNLNLSQNKLSGSIPPSLGNLINLTNLNFLCSFVVN